MRFTSRKAVQAKWGLDGFVSMVSESHASEARAIITDSAYVERDRKWARALGVPLYRVEPGPLRPYCSPGIDKAVNLSIRLVAEQGCGVDVLLESVVEPKHLLKTWKKSGLSWCNDRPPAVLPLSHDFTLLVLDRNDFEAIASLNGLLQHLLEGVELDNRPVVVFYPEALLDEAGIKVCREFLSSRRVYFIDDSFHVVPLLRAASRTIIGRSPLQLDARVHGSVSTFSENGDRQDEELNQDLLQAFGAGCFYRHPESGTPDSLESLVDWLTLQREKRFSITGQVYAFGFSRWKSPVLRTYFQGATVERVTADRSAPIPEGATILLWGSKPVEDYPGGARLVGNHYNLIRIEDAFIRSIGLGARLIKPVSWVLDDKGIYYDPRTPSRLEELLNSQTFSFDDQKRAGALIRRLVTEQVTKYNVGGVCWQRPDVDQRVILVAGQVESDASIKYGAGKVRTNMGLLENIRSKHPNAYILYKPHPDVLASLREEGESESHAHELCDEIITDAPMAQLLDVVDEVHVMTSLAGFEGLLRNKKVVVYGAPFYAGWGLTVDQMDHPRRNRRRSLEELVAAALIHYPTYVSLKTGFYMTPEHALDQLVEWRENGTYNPSRLKLMAVWGRRKVLNLLGR